LWYFLRKMERIFFVVVMTKFKKDYNFRIITIILGAVFLFNNALYAVPLHYNGKKLRIPVQNYERIKEKFLKDLSEKLSSKDTEEIDKGLEILNFIVNSKSILGHQDLLPLIEKAFISKGAVIFGSRESIGASVFILEKQPSFTFLVAWDLYIYEDEKTLSFSFRSDTAFDSMHKRPLGLRLEEEKRLLSLAYWWLVMQPGFQKNFYGWRIKADGINFVTAKVLLSHGPFKNMKVVNTDGYYFKGRDAAHPNMVINRRADGRIEFLLRNIDVMDGIDVTEIPNRTEDGEHFSNKRYDFKGMIPELRSSSRYIGGSSIGIFAGTDISKSLKSIALNPLSTNL